ncbi:MAG: hypothetical protein ACI9FU_000285, partial [Granulosicoccus sp.]
LLRKELNRQSLNSTIDASSFPTGMCIVKLVTHDQIYYGKLQVVH